MIKNKTTIGSIFAAILLVSLAFVPAVMAQTDVSKKDVVIEESPGLNVIKADSTSFKAQVGDVLITYESDPKYTEANMEIKNLTTDTVSNFNYKVSTINGKFKTDVYKEGKLVNSITSKYNLIEPGTTSKILKDSAAQNNAVLASQTKYTWDGVTFIKGSGIKYPHPDYNTYKAYNYQTFYITGNKLIHYHLSSSWSNAVAGVAPAVAGALMGARWGGAYGAAAGALLGELLGGSTGSALLDEQGCVWYWYSKSFATLYIVQIAPFGVDKVYAPYYLRVSTYTLWNLLGISNP